MRNNKTKGFTLMELMITVVIIGILAAIAIPSYLNYTRKAYFSEVVQATAPYKLGVEECYQATSDLAQCDAGSKGVPPALATAQGAVASIGVTDGVITVTPVAQNGIVATDTYILRPTVSGDILTWAAEGGGVDAGYAK